MMNHRLTNIEEKGETGRTKTKTEHEKTIGRSHDNRSCQICYRLDCWVLLGCVGLRHDNKEEGRQF